MNNANYWRGRFGVLEDAAHSGSVEYIQTLEREFSRASQSIQADIERWYGRFADNNNITLTEAKKLLTGSQLEEFKWTVQDYIKAGESLDPKWLKQLENASARVHVSRLEALKFQAQQQIELLYGNHTDDLDAFLRKIYSNGYYHTAFEIQRGMNVGWDLHSLNSKQLQTVLSRPWTTDNRTFRDRCWLDKTQLVHTVQTQLTQGIIRGDSPSVATKAIADQFRVSKNKAGRLVMTESAYFSAQSQKDCFRELDVKFFEIVVTLDELTCAVCGPLDGMVFPMSDYEPGVTANPFHPWCRCCTAPHFDDNAGERAARDHDGEVYYVPANIKFSEWKETFVGGGSKDGLKEVKSSDILQNRSKAQTATNPEVQKILDNYPVIEGEHSYSDDILATNPKYTESSKARDTYYTHNCQRCVSAYEARRRGYDVAASPRIKGSNDPLPYMMMEKGWPNVYENGQSALVKCFSRTGEGVKTKVTDQLLSWGNESRAIVRVQWRNSRSGHVFIAENHGGKVLFLDPQSGNMDVTHYFDMAKVNQTHVLRIDDKEFSTLIEKCCEYKGG